MIRRPPRSTLFPLHDALPISWRTRMLDAPACFRPGESGFKVTARDRRKHGTRRSEEHTSELQSRRDLVCRLLLEKKKKTATASQILVAHRLFDCNQPSHQRCT